MVSLERIKDEHHTLTGVVARIGKTIQLRALDDGHSSGTVMNLACQVCVQLSSQVRDCTHIAPSPRAAVSATFFLVLSWSFQRTVAG